LGYVLGFDAYMSGAFTELLLADVCLLCAVLGGKRVYWTGLGGCNRIKGA